MGKKTASIISILLTAVLLFPGAAYAYRGDSGYEGGISSGAVTGKSSGDYQEVVFITGEPIVFKGTVTVKKTMKGTDVASVYTYSLRNNDRKATLNRTLSLTTKLTRKDNGQTIEETSLAKPASETIKLDNKNYVLKSYDFTRSCVVDTKPAINYYAGNTWGKKTYQSGAAGSTAQSAATVTVEETGSFYGYDQYWGSTEVQTLNYSIECEKGTGASADKWGGNASVSLSSSSTLKLDYVKNQPSQISFEGGYVQTQQNSSILEYSSSLPEFDSKGMSTDNLISRSSSLKLETFPVQKRLTVPDTRYLRGHWAENDINILMSLEVLKDGNKVYNPEQKITRAEFVDALVQAAREVPQDPSLVSRTATASRTTKQPVVTSPFKDVSVDSYYFNSINAAYKRNLITGNIDGNYHPDSKIKLEDALIMLIRALGLENMAPNPQAKTTFRDDASIQSYARNSIYAAQKIGLAKGDSKGYLKPGEYMTKATAAVLLNDFIDYMRSGITSDYRERIVDYN